MSTGGTSGAAGAGGTGGGGTAGTAGSSAGTGGRGGTAAARRPAAAGGAAGGTGGGGSGGAAACPAIADFMTWTAGKGPADVGQRSPPTTSRATPATPYGGAGYALAFTWFGALRFTKLTGDTANNTTSSPRSSPTRPGTVTVDNSATATVDSRAFGDLPLEIWQQNMDTRCRTLGLARADSSGR